MPKLKKLSFKQKLFVQKFIETKNATEAAWQTYNCKNRNMARLLGHQNLNNPQVLRELEAEMEKKNITDDFLLERLKEGMDAKVVSQYQGEVKETDIPDHSAAYKWWEAAAKMKKFFPAEETINKNLNIDLQLETMPRQEFVDLLKTLLSSIKAEDKKLEQAKGKKNG